MRYAYKDLGEQPAGTEVTVRLEGSAANVLLLDEYNYSCYRASRPFRYCGGMQRKPRASLTVPREGRWHLVIDLGGYRGRVRAHVERVIKPGGDSGQTTPREESMLEAVS